MDRGGSRRIRCGRAVRSSRNHLEATQRIAAIVGTSIVLLLTACSPNTPAPLPSPSEAALTFPSPAETSLTLACGAGFGPPGDANGITSEHSIWSLAWAGKPASRNDMKLPLYGSEWSTLKAPITVAALSGGSVKIVHPTSSARLLFVDASTWANLTHSSKELTPLSSTAVSFPTCDQPDTYPGMLLVRQPTCVTLQVAPRDVAAYEVVVPVLREPCD